MIKTISIIDPVKNEVVDYPIDALDIEISETDATEEELFQAIEALKEYTTDVKFGTAGRRNRDAVNVSCLARVIGADDTVEFIKVIASKICDSRRDYDSIMEAAERVEPYALRWGPDGNRKQALDYMI